MPIVCAVSCFTGEEKCGERPAPTTLPPPLASPSSHWSSATPHRLPSPQPHPHPETPNYTRTFALPLASSHMSPFVLLLSRGAWVTIARKSFRPRRSSGPGGLDFPLASSHKSPPVKLGF